MSQITTVEGVASGGNQQNSGIAFKEIGNTGLNTSSGYIYEEFLPKLQWPRAGAIYQEMSYNDPVITAILLCSRQLIRNVEWSVEAASKSKADEEAAEFLRTCMNDMSHTWSAFIDDLMSFFEYGWSYMELVYKKRNGPNNKKGSSSKYDDNRIGWRKISGRAQTTLQSWAIDDYGTIRGMYQYASNGVVFIPIERALLFRTTTARNNPEGKSFLRGAYRPWYFKKHIEEVEGIGIERDLAGLPVVTAPSGIDLFDKNNPKAIDTKNAALKLVSSIRRDKNEGVVLSDGWKIELLSSNSARQFDTNSVINRHDQRIAITMLSDIVMMGGDKVGSFALAKTKESMLAAALDAQLANVIDILNEIAIPRLFALNTFTGLTGLPKFKVTSVISPNLTDLGNFIKALSGAKMPLFPDIDLENYLRRIVNFPEVAEDDENRQVQLDNASQTKTKESEDSSKEEESEDKPNNDKIKKKEKEG